MGKKKKDFSMTRRIDGKRFNLGRIRTKKTSADKVAKSYREDGYKARVVPGKGGHGIYVRKRRRR